MHSNFIQWVSVVNGIMMKEYGPSVSWQVFVLTHDKTFVFKLSLAQQAT